jgi:hypothetical protein
VKKKKKELEEKDKPERKYQTNKDTVGINAERFCDEDQLFPWKSWEKVEDRRSLRKQGSRIVE